MGVKFTDRRSRLGLAVMVAVVALMGGRWAVPAMAAKAEPLIDNEWQKACVKHFEKRFFERIDATDDQRTQIDKLISDQMERSFPLREQLREGLVDLKDMMLKTDAKDEQIVDKAHELRAMHEKLMDQRLDTMLKIRQNLTAEQRKKINDRLELFLNCRARDHISHLLKGGAPMLNVD